MQKIVSLPVPSAAEDLRGKVSGQYATILADPPWQFQNRTGKMAPERKRLFARFPNEGWSQWGNEDVEENRFHGVARRNGHADEQMRLLEPPRNYRAR